MLVPRAGRWLAAAAALGVALAGVEVSDARAAEDGAPAAAVGVAGAVRGADSGGGAIFFNPAAMSLINRYSVGATYAHHSARDGHAVGVTVVDSRSNPFIALGAGYTYIDSEVGGVERDGSQWRVAGSVAFRGQTVTTLAGVGLHWLTLSSPRRDGQKTDLLTLDAGLLLNLAQRLTLGVVVKNILDTKAPDEAPFEIGVGAGIFVDALRLTGDVVVDTQTDPEATRVGWGVGARYIFAGAVSAQLGVGREAAGDDTAVSGGLGYISKDIGFDISYSQAVTGDNSDYVVATSITGHLPY